MHPLWIQLTALISSIIISSAEVTKASFVRQPDSVYYLVRSDPVTFSCTANDVMKMILTCNDSPVPQSKVIVTSDDQAGTKTLTTEFTKMDLDRYGTEELSCYCKAWSASDFYEFESESGVMKPAHLKKNFNRQPLKQEVEYGHQAEFLCEPPDGVPEAHVTWTRNNKPIQPGENPNFYITKGGRTLLVHQATFDDQGNYTCVATNIAGVRITVPAPLKVIVRGTWTPWSEWSECSSKCGRGIQTRSRECRYNTQLGLDRRASSTDICEGDAFETADCTKMCPQDGGWSEWGEWHACGINCVKYRLRECDSPSPSHGGLPCLGEGLDRANCTGDECRASAIADFGSGDSELWAGVVPRVEEDPSHMSLKEIFLYVGLIAVVAVFIAATMIVVFLIHRRNRMFTGVVTLEERHQYPSMHYATEIPMKTSKTAGSLPNIIDIQSSYHLQPVAPHMSSSSSAHNSMSPLPNSPPPGYPYDLYQTYQYIEEPATAAQQHKPQERLTLTSAIRGDQPSPGAHYTHISETDYYAKAPGTAKSTNRNSVHSRFSVDSGHCEQASHNSSEPEEQHLRKLPALPACIDPCSVAVGLVGYAGGRLSLPQSGISLLVPEGAIHQGDMQELFLASCSDAAEMPSNLAANETVLSASVFAGCTSGAVAFQKPLVLCFQQSALAVHQDWNMNLYTQTPGHNWKVASSSNGGGGGNDSVAVHFDQGNCYVVGNSLNYKYCLVGQASSSSATKVFQSVVFGGYLKNGLNYSIRTYLLNNNKDCLARAMEEEMKIGGFLLTAPVEIPIEFSSCSVMLSLENLPAQWRTKTGNTTLEIPVDRLWSDTHGGFHTTLSLECCGTLVPLTCHIRIQQKQQSSISIAINPCEVPTSPLIVEDGRVYASAQVFRLTPYVRNRLINSLGDAWPLLAQAMNLECSVMEYLKTVANPSESLLDIWECRSHTEPTLDLPSLLQAASRPDLAKLVECELGSSPC